MLGQLKNGTYKFARFIRVLYVGLSIVVLRMLTSLHRCVFILPALFFASFSPPPISTHTHIPTASSY